MDRRPATQGERHGDEPPLDAKRFVAMSVTASSSSTIAMQSS
jgi:hypothetical protein